MEISVEVLREKWANGKKLVINKKSYRVGKMSYGQYFLEPGPDRGETKPFNRGTLWLEKVPNNPYMYQIEDTLRQEAFNK